MFPPQPTDVLSLRRYGCEEYVKTIETLRLFHQQILKNALISLDKELLESLCKKQLSYYIISVGICKNISKTFRILVASQYLGNWHEKINVMAKIEYFKLRNFIGAFVTR